MKIHYVSGSRADFGLMAATLQGVAAVPGWDLSVILVGQALDKRYGDVEAAVIEAGLAIAGRVPAHLTGDTAQEMALAFAAEVEGLTRFWTSDRPDFALLLGDRGEMLAAAIVAFHLEIPTGHLHGGERSGSLDDGFRHAISKLATWHFPATDESAARLKRMGEDPNRIVVVGAPGLVALRQLEVPSNWLASRFPQSVGRPTALLLFHPVVQESDEARAQIAIILDSLGAAGLFVIALRPNSDAGGKAIAGRLEIWAKQPANGVLLRHLSREDFLRTLASVNVLVGNSSSGIIESASLGTACLNLGSRQDCRERNANVVDCQEFSTRAIGDALVQALSLSVAKPFSNKYGDGFADKRLCDALTALPIKSRATGKRNAY